jgi:hypothetical protein
MPSVKKNEKRNHYVKRAVHEMVHSEGLTPEQAVGKAEGMFTHAKKKRKRPESMKAFMKRRAKETRKKP